jgi:hypothetical protein
VAKQRFRNVSQLARDVGGGRVVAPGETVKLDEHDDQVRRLVDTGRLVRLAPPPKTDKTKPEQKAEPTGEES